ncbi:hypothetical protein E8P82_08935 [Arthrobacter echini]|uniref:Uncharacterized protein n=1 Tax=Arthrobacter echini TaxID=1529066 RepID=A0A4S5E500_9MICC|nr:hypothetical protein [Arthrobacter echini]THJ66564.1 hypothetical protein E8P82_08935 [Arthrobacter echini]
MIRIIFWLLTASIRYSYRLVRTIFRLPLLLLPLPPRVRNQAAGALAVGLWFLSLLVVVAAVDATGWAHLAVTAAAVLVIGGTVCIEGRLVLAYRPNRTRAQTPQRPMPAR